MDTTPPVPRSEIEKAKRPWVSIVVLFIIGFIFSYFGLIVGLIWIFWKGRDQKYKTIGALAAGFILALLIGASFGSYFQNKMMGFIESKSPELKTVYAALQKNYPNEKNINVNVNTFYGANNMESKSVTISVVGPSPISSEEMGGIAQTACTALQNANLSVDSVGVDSVIQKTYFWIFTTSISSGQNNTCNQWLSASSSAAFSNDVQQTKLLWNNGEYNQSLTAAEKLLTEAKTDGDKSVAHYWIGLSYYKMNNISQAQQEELLSVQLDPTFNGPYVTLAAISLGQNDCATAMNYAEKALSLDDTWAWAHNDLGLAYSCAGNKQQAIVELERAVQLDPNTQTFQSNLNLIKGQQ